MFRPCKTNVNETVQQRVDCETMTKIVLYFMQISVNVLLNVCNNNDQTLFFNELIFASFSRDVENLWLGLGFLTSPFSA